jgi:DNA-binding NarL/FixJ family response regulator
VISVLLADDHALVRDGLRMILEANHDIRVVGEAADGIGALRTAQSLAPQVAIMDISMPGMTGIEAGREIAQFSPQTRIIILSVHATREYIAAAFRMGVLGYLAKVSAGSEVVKAVRSVAAGKKYVSQILTDKFVDAFLGTEDEATDRGGLRLLSPREREVLKLVAEGKSSAEIGGLLFLSAKTVDTYRSRLMRKLDLRNLTSVVKYAIRMGLVPLE